ncbi:MAG: DUF3048 domain-containing protein [Lachnospiraceae bacterium]|nr:DUF3048 domain-containing protein [Lachnospiraceae bacterium]
MKKRLLLLVLGFTCAGTLLFTACGSKDDEDSTEAASEASAAPAMVVQDTAPVAEEPAVEEEESDVPPEGMVANPLTGEWIDQSIEDQRPIAVMIDDEKTALPHYGVSEADIIYEIMNSTQNDGVTRFMAMFKDWAPIEQIGSIRSTRPTNLQTFTEWNAVLCHDGGPFYNDMFYSNDFVDRFSGTFSRVNNGKAREFTEYALKGDVEKNFKNNSKISVSYNEYYRGEHYKFATRNNPNTLEQYSSAKAANKITIPFHHNNPWLEYNADEGVYYYFQYGDKEVDAGNGNKQVCFKNLLLQGARLEKLDDHGYMFLHTNDSDYSDSDKREGWYITNGKAIKVTWTKMDDTYPTKYFDENGEEIKINVGKTYVAIMPSGDFGDIKIE